MGIGRGDILYVHPSQVAAYCDAFLHRGMFERDPWQIDAVGISAGNMSSANPDVPSSPMADYCSTPQIFAHVRD